VLLLDRRNLTQDGDPQCFANGISLQTYLRGLTGSDIVVVGTNSGQAGDSGMGNGYLDTTAIGGSAYNCSSTTMVAGTTGCSSTTPGGTNDIATFYLAIGAVNAKPGSAYEYYVTPGDPVLPSAYAEGMFVEDANGNYNFQSYNNVEYIVSPGATAATTSVSIMNTPDMPAGQTVYTPPSPPTGRASGFWLLVLNRSSLHPENCPSTQNGNNYSAPGCGTFYPTNTATNQDVLNLANDLGSVGRGQLAILTSVGVPGWNSSASAMASQGDGTSNNTDVLGGVLQKYGIPDKSILYTGATGSAYTMIGSPGLGGPLTGHNVLSTTTYSAQGQTGYVHGTFARDSHGLYEPTHTEQQSSAQDNANVDLGIILSMAPQEWPELGTVLASGNTLTGQTAAYQYLSYYLLNQKYVVGEVDANGNPQPGVTGTYAYDIHYFFTGSLNTSIDYHTYDPIDATYPGTSWTSPDGKTLSFTQQEFNSVKYQMHNEVVALTNVLTYLVTGSTNFKDLVAAGNSNAALSLLQAVSEVQANISQIGDTPPPTTPVTVSPFHIMQRIAGDAGPALTIATDGVINPEDIALVNKAIGFVGDLYAAAGSTGGGLSTGDPSPQKEIPRLDYRLDTTIGNLAGADLQGQILAGFDATLDSITGDWAKLQAVGGGNIAKSPLFTPKQTTQNEVINMITKSSQKSMYLSLIPQIYQVHRWTMTGGGMTNSADFGYTKNGDTNSCHQFYDHPQGAWAAVTYPTYGGTQYWEAWHNDNQGTYGDHWPFQYIYGIPYLDFYMLALPFTNQGSSGAASTVINPNVAGILFGNGSGQLNIPRDEFVAIKGPMDVRITDGGSSSLDMAYEPDGANPGHAPYTNPIGIENGNICSAGAMNGTVSDAPRPVNPRATTTTLRMAASAVLGSDLNITASVAMASGSSIPAGKMNFKDGSNIFATVPLDSMGTASNKLSGLTLGTHSITAYFIPSDSTSPSDSGAISLMVYANSPEMQLTLSQSTLDVSYSNMSSALSLNVQALYGLAGTVNYTCSGLPAGMNCAFSPSSSTVADGGMAKTTFTISGSPLTAASSLGITKGWGIILLPVPLLLAVRLRSKARIAGLAPLLVLLVFAIGSLSGCGGGSSNQAPTQAPTFKETGTKTVLVTAASGTVTRTVPLVVTIK
jgi:hypothetical protein